MIMYHRDSQTMLTTTKQTSKLFSYAMHVTLLLVSLAYYSTVTPDHTGFNKRLPEQNNGED